MWVNVFSDDITIAFDNVAHLSLFEGKNRSIIWELLCGNVFGEHFDRFCVQMDPPLLPSFRFRDVDYAISHFNVARPDVEQLANSHAGAPQYPQHEVVSCAALVCSLKYCINLFLFQVVGDVLH